jgi:hypothetical protein
VSRMGDRLHPLNDDRVISGWHVEVNIGSDDHPDRLFVRTIATNNCAIGQADRNPASYREDR